MPPGRSCPAIGCSASCSSGLATSTSRTRSRCCPTSSSTATTGEDYASTTGLEQVRPHRLRRLPAGRRCQTSRSWPSRRHGRATSATSPARSNSRASAEPPPDEPLLHDVDLTRTHVARAQRMELPAWARTVIPGPAQAPLLYAGTRDGLATAVLAFDLRQSDLPLQVAWPILVANLSGELLGPRRQHAAARSRPARRSSWSCSPGQRRPAGHGARRDGDGAPTGAPSGGGSVTFVGTSQLGAYTSRSRSPSRRAPAASGAAAGRTSSPSPSPSGSEAPVAAGPDPLRGRPLRPRRVEHRARRRRPTDRASVGRRRRAGRRGHGPRRVVDPDRAGGPGVAARRVAGLRARRRPAHPGLARRARWRSAARGTP